MESTNDKSGKEEIAIGTGQRVDQERNSEGVWNDTQRQIDDIEKAIERCAAEYFDLYRRVEHTKTSINEYAVFQRVRETIDFDEINAMARRISAAKNYLANHQEQIIRATAQTYKRMNPQQIAGIAKVRITEWMPSCPLFVDVENVVYLELK
jgi:molecular chaperone GrpE (heat shock protein)